MDYSCSYDYILSGQRWKKEYLSIIYQTKDPDLVLNFVEYTRLLLSYAGSYPDFVLINLEQHLNKNKVLFENEQLAIALIKSWNYHATALCFYKVKDYQSVFETLSAALINDCNIYLRYNVKLMVDSIFMLCSRLLDMSLINHSFASRNQKLKKNLLKSLSTGILNISNCSIDICDYINTTEPSNAVLYVYPMNRIFFQDLMSFRINKSSNSIILNNIENYIQFFSRYISTNPFAYNTPLVSGDSLFLSPELSKIINLNCLIDVHMIKNNKLRLNFIPDIYHYCLSQKSYFVSSNELELLNSLSNA